MDVGATISSIRKKHGLTIKDVSAMSGVTSSLISQIENNKANPSLSTLICLAKALNVDVSAFFNSEAAEQSASPVVRASERLQMTEMPDWKTYLLTNNNYDKFTINLTVIQPEADSSNYPELHPKGATGYEFGYVLSGKLHVELEGQIYILNAGDSICFDAGKEHAIKNIFNSETQLLWMMLP